MVLNFFCFFLCLAFKWGKQQKTKALQTLTWCKSRGHDFQYCWTWREFALLSQLQHRCCQVMHQLYYRDIYLIPYSGSKLCCSSDDFKDIPIYIWGQTRQWCQSWSVGQQLWNSLRFSDRENDFSNLKQFFMSSKPRLNTSMGCEEVNQSAYFSPSFFFLMYF